MLVESAIWLSKKTKIPSMVVGATIVALATTFPETSVSFFSGLNGAEELALNTAIGSMLSNFALVLGISFLVKPVKVSKNNFSGKVVYFLLCTIILFILGIDGKISLFDAIILAIVFVLFLIINFCSCKDTDIKPLESLEPAKDIRWPKIILQFFISAFSIGFGANLMVSNVDKLSQMLNVSEGVFGMFIISVGTNIPELVTTLTAAKQNDAEIGIGNIFGSSIIDATLLISVSVFACQQNLIFMPIKLLIITIIMLVIITIIIVVPIIKNGTTNRWQGVVLLVLFLIYIMLVYRA